MEVSLTRQFSAIAASVANSTAFLLRTGKAPGIPRHTGHTFVFGGAPNRVEHEQNIFVAVSSWTCTSSPITGSNRGCAATDVWVVVATGMINFVLRVHRRIQILVHRNLEIH